MYRQPGKGAGNASAYSAANKKIASFSSVTPVQLIELTFSRSKISGQFTPISCERPNYHPQQPTPSSAIR